MNRIRISKLLGVLLRLLGRLGFVGGRNSRRLGGSGSRFAGNLAGFSRNRLGCGWNGQRLRNLNMGGPVIVPPDQDQQDKEDNRSADRQPAQRIARANDVFHPGSAHGSHAAALAFLEQDEEDHAESDKEEERSHYDEQA